MSEAQNAVNSLWRPPRSRMTMFMPHLGLIQYPDGNRVDFMYEGVVETAAAAIAFMLDFLAHDSQDLSGRHIWIFAAGLAVPEAGPIRRRSFGRRRIKGNAVDATPEPGTIVQRLKILFVLPGFPVRDFPSAIW